MAAKHFWQTTANAAAYLREFGARRFLMELNYRIINRCHERWLGIETSGMVRLEEVGIDREESVEYTPIGYSAVYHVLRRLPIPASSVSFLDLGSGKGRVVVVAATFPFKKVLGVEISERFHRLAQANVDRMRHRRAEIVELIQSDAVEFAIPDDVNVIYLFNPFTGKTLKRVVDNILASYAARACPVYVIYFNTMHFERIIKDEGYERIKPIYQTYFYPNYSCSIYEIKEAAGPH
jgi:predicted RNA methylase